MDNPQEDPQSDSMKSIKVLIKQADIPEEGKAQVIEFVKEIREKNPLPEERRSLKDR